MRTLLLFWGFVFLAGKASALLPVLEANENKSSVSGPVILVSMDGFRADYWDKVETPRFHELMRQGVRASSLKPVFPSVTFVNHYSIVTGLFSENHGIVNNSMWDPETQRKFEISDSEEVDRSEWWEGEPIWVTAEKQGLKTGSMFWVGSSTEIKGVRPTYWFPYDSSVTRSKRVRQVLDWLDLPAEKRPRFITLYFEDADEAGHANGPDSDQVKQAIKALDNSIGELWDGLKARGIQNEVTLILLSDHGMARVDRKNRIRLVNYVKSYEARVVGKGALSLVWPKSKKEFELILERVKKNPGPFIVYEKEKMPQQFHYSRHRRISPLVFLANLGWYIDSGFLPSIKPKVFGLHGYDNSLSEMQASFLAVGPRFLKNISVDEVMNVDIYALLAKLLNVEAASNDGSLERISKTLHLIK